MDLSNRPRLDLIITLTAATICLISSTIGAAMIYPPAGMLTIAAWSGFIAWLAATEA